MPPSGNVGIGTTSPEMKLDVKGKVNIDSTLIVRDSVTIKKNLRVEENVNFLGNTKLKNVHVRHKFRADSSAMFNGTVRMPNLEFSTNLNNKNLVITNQNGNLKKITVDSYTEYLKRELYSPFINPCLVDINGNIVYGTPYWQAEPQKMYIDASQCMPNLRVGIRTPNPKSTLDVNGMTLTEKLGINVDPSTTSMGTSIFYLKSTYSSSGISASFPLFVIANQDSTLFQISNNGITRAREIIINNNQPWPDYVFEQNYKLKSLDEVESFILKNGHLPNVPSAKEIQEKGVNVAEMNRVLLEKVEELTLHLIEQQKQLKEQAQKITELETKMNQR